MQRLILRSFKNIEEGTLDLAKITVLVGGNNAGKSCYLHGAHMGITLIQMVGLGYNRQIHPERLRYSPTDDFIRLKHRGKVTESQSVDFEYHFEDGQVINVKMKRGANAVLKAEVIGDEALRIGICNTEERFFSIFVPGLAGIALKEEWRSEMAVYNGVGRGDSNLFLRNLLYRIETGERAGSETKTYFHSLLGQVFPGYSVETRFNQREEVYLPTYVKTPNNGEVLLDSIGTGFLQAVQLIAYVTLYKPTLLMLDEPDAHLNPGNQRLMAKLLGIIAKEGDTQIILATHSRHLLDAFSEMEDTKLYWIKEGKAELQNSWSDVSVLMDLGALDSGEMFLEGSYKYLVWTEDRNHTYLKTLLEANGFDLSETFIWTYETSAKFEAAAMLSSFINRVKPGVRIVIHRDRDFMLDDEVEKLIGKYKLDKLSNCKLFVTKGSDIESYFTSPAYLAEHLSTSPQDTETLIQEAISKTIPAFVNKFRDKRDNIKWALYKDDLKACPSATDMLGDVEVPPDKALGKLLLTNLNGILGPQGKPINGKTANQALVDADIANLKD